jgi:HEPN domain-containing protein
MSIDPKSAMVALWLTKAHNDLSNSDIILSSKREKLPLDTVCFHAQQAIEKALKGLLAHHGGDVSRSHDLVKLLNDAKQLAPELVEFTESMELISEYGVGIRYPDFYYEPSLPEAHQAYEVAKKVVAVIEESISKV